MCKFPGSGSTVFCRLLFDQVIVLKHKYMNHEISFKSTKQSIATGFGHV